MVNVELLMSLSLRGGGDDIYMMASRLVMANEEGKEGAKCFELFFVFLFLLS